MLTRKTDSRYTQKALNFGGKNLMLLGRMKRKDSRKLVGIDNS